jgi:hypothetical protein
MKFLRVIRFDHSDDHVFARAAAVDEWVVSGGFEYAHVGEEDLVGKLRQGFANGFLGLPSFGRATFAMVNEMSADERRDVESLLARHFIDAYGAPGDAEAAGAARDEVEFVADICADKPINTVFAVQREIEDGGIREAFREVRPPGADDHARIWDVVEDGS